MRRILVERARRRNAEKHGGKDNRVELSDFALLRRASPDEIVTLNDLLDEFAKQEPEAAEIVKLKIFADFSVEEAGGNVGHVTRKRLSTLGLCSSLAEKRHVRR